MSKVIYHYWRYRDGKYRLPCGSRKGAIRLSGRFNCKRCYKIVHSKAWSERLCLEMAKSRYFHPEIKK